MAIKFKCPNPACARSLTVKDEAAGRAGKCPSCGAALTVPQLVPVGHEEPDPYALVEEQDTAPEPALRPVSNRPNSQATAATLGGPVYDGEVGSSKAAGGAVRFSAIGLGMSLLGKRLGTWVLAVVVFGLTAGGLNLGITIASALLQMVLRPVLGEQLAALPGALLQAVAQTAVVGVLMGGIYRMALKQLDGHEFGVGDMFGVSDVALNLAVTALIVQIITMIGSLFLVIPGLIAAGLLMFSGPLIVDGRLGIADALRVSFESLKSDWWKAPLFLIVLSFICLAGVLPCFVGLLFTMPIVFLATAAQYRRNFAPGAKPRAAVVEDPWAEAVGQPLSERREPKMPGMAWVLFAVGLFVPVVVVVLIAVAVGALVGGVMKLQQQQQQQGQMPGGAFPGFGDMKPGQVPPGFPQMDLKPGQMPPEAEKEMAKAFEQLKAQMQEALKAQQKGQVPTIPPVNRPDAPERLVPPGFPNPAPNSQGNRPANSPRVGTRQPSPRGSAGMPPQQKASSTPVTPPAPEPTPAEILAALDGKEASAQLKALAALTRIPVDPPTQEQIAQKARELLNAPDVLTRAAAARALGYWGRPEDTPALVTAMSDPERTVVRAAIDALGRHKDPQAIEPMLRRTSEPTLRGSVLAALRRWGAEIEPELLKYLKDDDRDVRETACQALRDVGTTASLVPLRNALNDRDEGVVAQARRALQAVENRVGAPSSKRTLIPRSKTKR